MDLSQALTRISDLERDLAAKSESLTTANAALQEISRALDDAGAPACYTEDGEPEGKPIPAPERIRLLGERARAEHAERIREGDRADLYRKRLADADRALDDAGAPRLADGAPLSPAARVRGLSCR